MKMIIFGNGQIGGSYKEYFASKGWEVSIPLIDITDAAAVAKVLSEEQPEVVINCAARTSLEYCANNKLDSFNSNVLGADNIATACDKLGIYFVHLSSGCIYQSTDENDAKVETDEPNPAAFYSWTKVWAEELIAFNKSAEFKYMILRPRQPITASLSHRNTLIKMLTFTRYIDIPNSLTVLEDLLEWTEKLITQKATGVFHTANPGWTSPYRIAQVLKQYILPELDPILITRAELDRLTPNKRVDTILNMDRLIAAGIKMKPIEERLVEIAKELAENMKQADKQELREILEQTAKESAQRTIVNEVWPKLLD